MKISNRPRVPRQRLAVVCAALLATAWAGGQQRDRPPDPMRPFAGNPLIAEGDYHYARRQDGRVGARASEREIALAISAYDSASRAPDTAEARWKLARALYFKAAYTGVDADAQKALYEKARRAGDEAIEIVQRRSKGSDFSGDSDAAASYFWSAVAWGQWALLAGKLESAKTGVADKIRAYSTSVIGIDPTFEEGGGYRILGRLHDQAPWIPFLTGWVSRDEAIKYLRLAVATNGDNFVNRLFLAEALVSGSSAEAKEAVGILERLLADGPSPTHLVEDLNIQEDARKDLAQWKK
ncbi:MAG TPA: hypothetical protein VF376_07750 [Thermoanaerobaculia bacterium]